MTSARLDGAGHLRAFLSIVVPVSRNSIITAGLFSFLFTWSDLIFALTHHRHLGKADHAGHLRLPQRRRAELGSGDGHRGALLDPAIVLLIFAQRYIAAGALGGAVK